VVVVVVVWMMAGANGMDNGAAVMAGMQSGAAAVGQANRPWQFSDLVGSVPFVNIPPMPCMASMEQLEAGRAYIAAKHPDASFDKKAVEKRRQMRASIQARMQKAKVDFTATMHALELEMGMLNHLAAGDTNTQALNTKPT